MSPIAAAVSSASMAMRPLTRGGGPPATEPRNASLCAISASL
ncbi:uncharacterized protein METZ01_LOCUS279092, partial [marine metagenome]